MTQTRPNQEKIPPNYLYILSALVEDKPGVLFRITNLFRARNFNIESITVGSTESADLSRMTITTTSDERTLDQLVKQLRKVIDVVEVRVLDRNNTVYRELALIKMNAKGPSSRTEITNLASIFRGNILDIDKATLTVEITGTPDKIEAFRNLVSDFGVVQLARTGVSALPRGGYEGESLDDSNGAEDSSRLP
jgi:acetolactate synthase-1/3 small subunit